MKLGVFVFAFLITVLLLAGPVAAFVLALISAPSDGEVALGFVLIAGLIATAVLGIQFVIKRYLGDKQ